MHHKDLQVWKRSIAFVSDIYKILESFPKSEQFWLIDQIKRASISIASNIAEWCARWTEKEQKHFLYIARGSCSEIDTQLLIAKNLGFILQDSYNTLETELAIIGKMLTKLIQSCDSPTSR